MSVVCVHACGWECVRASVYVGMSVSVSVCVWTCGCICAYHRCNTTYFTNPTVQMLLCLLLFWVKNQRNEKHSALTTKTANNQIPAPQKIKGELLVCYMYLYSYSSLSPSLTTPPPPPPPFVGFL